MSTEAQDVTDKELAQAREQNFKEPAPIAAAKTICYPCSVNEHQACKGGDCACDVKAFHSTSAEPSLQQLSKYLEDAQARFRICSGKFDHAQTDLEVARKNFTEARDEVIEAKERLREAVDKIGLAK